MMRVLIIRSHPSFLDIKLNTYNIQEIGLAKALIKQGCECDVLLWTGTEEKTIDIELTDSNYGIKVYYKRGLRLLKNALFLGCNELFNSYDILQVSEYNQIQSWILAKRYPKKVVIYHGPYYSHFNKKYNLMSFFFDLFFLKDYKRLETSFLTKSHLAEEYLRKKRLQNVKTIGVGIDADSFKCNIDDNKFICELKHHSEDKILYIGKLEPRRNVFFLIDIVKEICAHKQVLLVIVGDGRPRYVKSFFNYAKKMGVYDNLLYCKSIQQNSIWKLYTMTNVFVIPTRYDIFGMVILEAMYFRKCVFTTLNGGSEMMIKNGENGYVFSGFDVEEWSDKVLEVLNSRIKQNELGDRAHKTVEERFTWDVLCLDFIDLYMRIISVQ